VVSTDTQHPVRVVQLGGLMPFVREWLSERYAAPEPADLEDPTGVVVAVVGGGAKAGAAEMDALPDLRAIVNFGVGYDNVDVVEAERRGIVVSNTPDVLTDAVADLAAFLVVDVLRGITAADRFVRSGAWGRGEKPRLTRDVRGAVVGVLGLGRIGTAAAERLEAFGAQIHYHSRSPKDVAWTYHDSPVALAGASDVLVVLTPGGAGTDGLVDAVVLDALGPDGYLVNVAGRGARGGPHRGCWARRVRRRAERARSPAGARRRRAAAPRGKCHRRDPRGDGQARARQRRRVPRARRAGDPGRLSGGVSAVECAPPP
jgi:hypothetical protein